MNSNFVDVLEMAAVRDSRKKIQNALIDKTDLPLISFTLNIPGAEKDTLLYREIHDKGIKEVESLFPNIIKEKIVRNLKTGPEAYFAINLDPKSIKKRTISIEENYKAGRIFDLDVIKTDGFALSRIDIHQKPRRCLLCNEKASICSRNRTHSVPELLKKINSVINML